VTRALIVIIVCATAEGDDSSAIVICLVRETNVAPHKITVPIVSPRAEVTEVAREHLRFRKRID
jgi:hypothetical protein